MTEQKKIGVKIATPVLVKNAISPEATLINGEPDYFCLNGSRQEISCNYAGFKKWHDSIDKRRKTLHGMKILDTRNLNYRVITSFLGHAHGYDDEYTPILWETVVLSKQGLDLQRYSCYHDAMRGHKAKMETIMELQKLRA